MRSCPSCCCISLAPPSPTSDCCRLLLGVVCAPAPRSVQPTLVRLFHPQLAGSSCSHSFLPPPARLVDCGDPPPPFLLAGGRAGVAFATLIAESASFSSMSTLSAASRASCDGGFMRRKNLA